MVALPRVNPQMMYTGVLRPGFGRKLQRSRGHPVPFLISVAATSWLNQPFNPPIMRPPEMSRIAVRVVVVEKGRGTHGGR